MVYCSCAENTNSSKFFDIKASPLVRICLINGDVYLAKIYIQTSYRYLYREWIVISSKKARVGKFCPDLFADVYRSAAKYTSIKMWGTVKSFALQRVKSKTAPLVKGKPPVFHEIKSTHYRSNFTRVQPGFHTAKQYFTHPQGGFHWKKGTTFHTLRREQKSRKHNMRCLFPLFFAWISIFCISLPWKCTPLIHETALIFILILRQTHTQNIISNS